MRSEVMNYLEAGAPTESFVEMIDQYEDIDTFLSANSLTMDSKWVGVQFIPFEEIPVSLSADGTKGCYREFGSINVHVVAPAGLGGSDMLSRAAKIHKILRGRRIGSTVIESVVPPNTSIGATLAFDAGFMSATIVASYYRDINL